MKKQNLIMFVPTALFFLLMLAFPAYAQQNSTIVQLDSSPSEPVVLEDMKLSIRIKNPTDAKQNYLMELDIVNDGKIVQKQEFTFSIDGNKELSFAPSFTPEDIGKFNAIVKLYDKFKIDVLDTKIIYFNVVSHLGPFDIIVEPLTSRVRPGLFLPAKLILENMGTKGTDVEVRLSVNCPEGPLQQSLTVFVPQNNRTENLVSLQTCPQEGLYEITGNIILFNRTWVSSFAQFFVNSTFTKVEFEAPENLTLKQGGSIIVPIEITNLGNERLTGLTFVVQRIPLSWQKISPSEPISIEPNEKAVFVVEVNIPSDADARMYEIRWTVSSRELLERRISTLEVVPLSALPLASTQIVLFRYVAIAFVGMSIVSVLLVKHFRKPKIQIPPVDRTKMLKKLKEEIENNS